MAGVVHFGGKESGCFSPLWSVSQRSRNFSGPFWGLKFPLCFRNAEVLSHQSNPLGFFYNKNMLKDQLLKTSRLKFDNRLFGPVKVLGTLQEQAPGYTSNARLRFGGKTPLCRCAHPAPNW